MPAETPTELLAAMLRDIDDPIMDPFMLGALSHYEDRIRDALDGAKVAVRLDETEAGDRVCLTLTEVEYVALKAEVEREPRVVPVLAAVLRRHRREVAPPIDPINIDALMRGEG